MGSLVVAGVRHEIEEAVFALRMAVPYSWQGPAADAFAERLEEVAAELGQVAIEVQGIVALLQWHEQQARMISIALGSGV